LPILGEHSILLLDRIAHSRQRKLIFPAFHGEKIRDYGEIMAEITQKVAQQWESGKIFSMGSSMQEITLEVIMQTVFGISDSDRHTQLKSRLTKTLELTSGSILRSSLLFFPILQQDFWGSPWRNIMQRQKSVNELLQGEIEERRTNNPISEKNVLSLLISSRDEDGNPMSDEDERS